MEVNKTPKEETSMKNKSVILPLLVLCLSLNAANTTWWNEEVKADTGSTLIQVPKTGDMRALIIVARFLEDSFTSYPYPALYDSLICDSIQQRSDSTYKWSITNFIYKSSWGKDTITGSVNPGMSHEYVLAPHPLSHYLGIPWYPDNPGGPDLDRVDSLEKDLIETLDPYVDFNDYDADHDGYVDFIFFILPFDPTSGLVKSYSDNTPDSSNYGVTWSYHDLAWGETVNLDDASRWKSGNVKASRSIRFGSTMSFYYPDSNADLRINLGAAAGLACHELGHSFGGGTDPEIKDDYGNFSTALGDRYDFLGGNWFSGSGGIGKYSVMQLGYYTNHPHLYSPFERYLLGWLEPQEITVNSQNKSLYDLTQYGDDEAYLIPVDSVAVDTGALAHWLREYFILTNYQAYSYWNDDLGRVWSDELGSGPVDSAHGLLIWHINEQFWTENNVPNELAKYEDLECAEGLHDLSGDTNLFSPWKTEAGWDRLDRWVMKNTEGGSQYWASRYNASSCHYTDFFNPNYKTAFHTLMNPSSDGYNMRSGPGYTYTYSGDSGVGPAMTERLVLQNLPTHLSIEGIHYNSGREIEFCIRRSRIWTDQEMAMDRTTQRKFICDSDDTFHFIYPLKGHIYYTKTYDPSLIWYKAEMVGNDPLYYDSIGYGVWPAMALDNKNFPIAVYFDTSTSSEKYSYKEIFSKPTGGTDTFWLAQPDTLNLSGIPGPVAIDYYSGPIDSTVNPGGSDVTNPPGGGIGPGTVHLAYINDANELHYTRFFKTTPENRLDLCLDANMDKTTRIVGASIEVDSIQKKICIAYGCVKDGVAASYYFEKDSLGHWYGPYQLPSSISDSTSEPLVPFVDADSILHRVVFNANEKVYAIAKLRSASYNNWQACSLITDMSGRNRYPQIGGKTVTWTNYVTADSSNVYKRTLLSGTTTRFDAAYDGKSYFAHVTKYGSGSAQLYQHGTFTGPKWAIYNGSGGNQESDGKPVPFIPPTGFKMSIPNNILVGSRLSIFTTGGDCMITVYDVSGRQVVRQELKGVQKLARIETPVDCNGWAKGVYFVRAIPKDGKVATSKVVLVR